MRAEKSFWFWTICEFITTNKSRLGWLNADLKQEMGKRVPMRTKVKLREAANQHMAMLERTPERVMGYFQDRRVRYAA